MKVARNVGIILGLAALVALAPGGLTASRTTSNILSILFFGGLAFFAYRLYMENRITLMDLPENHRTILYGSVGTLAITLIATRRIWDTQGPLILIWFMLVSAAVYGVVFVFRAYRDY
jgi:hypothetical protein